MTDAPGSDRPRPRRVRGGGPGRRRPTCPPGGEKTALVRSMFDTIAPRYDLVNRMMTFGLDVRWRRQSVRALGLPAGSRVLDLACGTGDFLAILTAAGLRPFGMDLSWGMLAANHTGRPLAQADGAALPVATGVGGRDHLRLRPSQFHRPRRGVRRVRPGGPPRGPDQPARGGRARHAACCVPATGSGSDRWSRSSAACSPTRAAYRYLPESTAYLPATAELRSMLTAPGSPPSTSAPCREGSAS